MKYKLFFIGFLLIESVTVYAQKDLKSSPLFKFLKRNADTTIVFHYENTWGIPPKYMILSKKGDTLSAFTYNVVDNIEKRAVMPHNFRYKLYEVSLLKFDKGPAAINEFFHPKYLSVDSIQYLWSLIVLQNPWKVMDDRVDGSGCPFVKGGRQGAIRDGTTYVLDLITKNRILNLKFYAPYYYEKEVCPGRDGRQRILIIDKLFQNYFGSN